MFLLNVHAYLIVKYIIVLESKVNLFLHTTHRQEDSVHAGFRYRRGWGHHRRRNWCNGHYERAGMGTGRYHRILSRLLAGRVRLGDRDTLDIVDYLNVVELDLLLYNKTLLFHWRDCLEEFVIVSWVDISWILFAFLFRRLLNFDKY